LLNLVRKATDNQGDGTSVKQRGGDAILLRDIYVADRDEQAWAEAASEITRVRQLATDNVWRGDSRSRKLTRDADCPNCAKYSKARKGKNLPLSLGHSF
jgi:hypothetical protein